jgi:hypothetical protein
MRNQRFVKIVVWVVVLGMVFTLAASVVAGIFS